MMRFVSITNIHSGYKEARRKATKDNTAETLACAPSNEIRFSDKQAYECDVVAGKRSIIVCTLGLHFKW